jgi:predicted nuclease of predicted toxin-antitoxin system
VKILFDQGTPFPLRKFLPSADVRTAAECGWSDLSNGELISAAEKSGFGVIVTTDTNLRYQQNLSGRIIAIAVVLRPAWPTLRERAEEVARAIEAVRPGTYIEI